MEGGTRQIERIMEDIVIDGKALYTPKGAALEYGRVGCNFYTGCYHGCEYCYLKLGIIAKQLGGTEIKLKKGFKDKEDALNIFMKEVNRHIDYLRKVGIFFSFTTDPLIPETRELTYRAILICAYRNIPVKVLTKNADFLGDNWMVRHLSDPFIHKCVSIGFTLTGRDDMEPNASTNEARIKAMRKLHMVGFKTWARIEPVIDWSSTDKIITDSLNYCDHYKIGLRSGVGKGYYDSEISTLFIISLVYDIIHMDRTVYLKESVRKILQQTMTQEEYNLLMLNTVDMDGNPINGML